jgi:acyl-CoA thioester hydrolase
MSEPVPWRGPPLFVHRRVVAFSETDAARMVHFSNLFRYLEDCEHAFVRSLGDTVHGGTADGGFLGFPRVEATCRFLRPLRFEDRVEVELRLVERRTRSVRWGFVVRREGEAAPVAVGAVAVVCVSSGADGELRPVLLPAVFGQLAVDPGGDS